MNTKTIIAVAVAAIAVLAVISIILVSGGGGDDGRSEPNVTDAVVWLDRNDGSEPVSFEGSGGDIRGIVESALSGYDVVFRANGNISSVDGVGNDDSRTWIIYRWASPGGWAVFSDTESSYVDGMNIAVRYSDRTVGDKGDVSYSAPDIEVDYEVFFFIQIREEASSTVWLRNLPLSDSDKKKGVWISGRGSTSSEALADAVLTNFFPRSSHEVVTSDDGGQGSVKYVVDGKEGMFTYGMTPSMYGWFVSFLGWSDTKVGSEGDYGTWTFWNQYTYSPDADSLSDTDYWGFNQFSFGMYDISEYRYFALVLKTSSMEDSFIDLSTPSEILRLS